MSAAVDTYPHTRLDAPRQDVALPSLAPTPSGCRDWFVVATKPKAERRAHAALHLKGYRPYLPLITVRLPNRHYRTGPLFPGYLFTHIDLAHPWYPIRYAPGVFSLISVDGVPLPCPQGAVEAILAGEEARQRPTTQESLYRPQQPCRAFLAGGEPVDAVVMAVRGDRAVVAAVMFGHLREINVSLDSLELRC